MRFRQLMDENNVKSKIEILFSEFLMFKQAYIFLTFG